MSRLEEAENTFAHKPWLAGYCFLTFAATLVLMYAGGFTTTIGAGMAFPDWPLSNGSLNPPGWTTDQAMMAEHGHRLLGATVGTLCIGLVVLMVLHEPRNWMRRLSYFALALVVFQGLLGGLRVLWVNIDLAKVHGVTAQLFLCCLAAISIGSSRWWKSMEVPTGNNGLKSWKQLRVLGLIICGLTVVQLVVGAVMRHRGAGLAIPYFPHASPDGSFLPVAWNWATQLNFTHRAIALIIYIAVMIWIYLIRSQASIPRVIKNLSIAAFLLIHAQILLGAFTIWSSRGAIETTLHVLNGALFLSTCWGITFSLFKPYFVATNLKIEESSVKEDLSESILS